MENQENTNEEIEIAESENDEDFDVAEIWHTVMDDIDVYLW